MCGTTHCLTRRSDLNLSRLKHGRFQTLLCGAIDRPRPRMDRSDRQFISNNTYFKSSYIYIRTCFFEDAIEFRSFFNRFDLHLNYFYRFWSKNPPTFT